MKIIKYLQLRRTLRRIKRAKKLYLNGVYYCMCHCMIEVFFPNKVEEEVPEFNTDFLGVERDRGNLWWPLNDRSSRIQAFNILIGHYENKIKNL